MLRIDRSILATLWKLYLLKKVPYGLQILVAYAREQLNQRFHLQLEMLTKYIGMALIMKAPV